uniref:N-acetylmuramoyl-L-alanine amidase n=1 Tax=Agathobacter sp. TaxID=2021311 RepID=UPI004056DF5A
MKKYKRILGMLLIAVLLLSACSTGTKFGSKDTQMQSETKQNGSEQSSESDNTQSTENETSENEVSDSESEMAIPEKETVMYAKTSLNVRSGASASHEKLGVLSMNQEVTALGDAVDGWQMIRFENGRNGIAYVSAKYLSTEKYVQKHTSTQIVIPEVNREGLLVVIDAGHQRYGDKEKEPNGPGSDVMKAKVTSGTSGCVSGLDEYELNLTVALKLRDELQSRGYEVVMVRETHDVKISNSERAMVANNHAADAFVRIHANSSDDSSVYGAMTICQTPSNPYNGHVYAESRELSDCVLDAFVASTGCKKRSVWETDTMTGLNWCMVPSTIIEMGFMSNPTEDALMATEDYRNKMVKGIADGLDLYFADER